MQLNILIFYHNQFDHKIKNLKSTQIAAFNQWEAKESIHEGKTLEIK